MTRAAPAIALLALTALHAWSGPASAGMGQAYVGADESEGEKTPFPETTTPLDNAPQLAIPGSRNGESARAAPGAFEAEEPGSFTVLTRTVDGTVQRGTPSLPMDGQQMRGSLGAQSRAMPQPPMLSSAGDPSFDTQKDGEESDRQVFGTDDRIQVLNTKVYPFKAFGYIQARSGEGKGSCSGTLIGPRTVLTAAHCIYSHETKDWLSDIRFAPGLNGLDAAPFGIYQAESTSILEGFISNYQGDYSAVVPWDLGIITLSEPVGDTLGWLGYANYDGLGDFTANIVGYPGDKDPPALMWRVNCEVPARNVAEANFDYDCDTYPGSSGSAVYAYDEQLKQRVIVGVNIAENTEFNTAVRLTEPYVAWINSLWK